VTHHVMLAIHPFSLFSVVDVVGLYTHKSYTCSGCYVMWDLNSLSCFWCHGTLYPLVLHLLCQSSFKHRSNVRCQWFHSMFMLIILILIMVIDVVWSVPIIKTTHNRKNPCKIWSMWGCWTSKIVGFVSLSYQD
jgi:hypothetical protein